jgi:serine/threonine-protein kinase RsbW
MAEGETETRMDESIRLAIPASADFVVLARFTAGAIATRAGFDIEELQDLQLAVDELIAAHDFFDQQDEIELEFTRRGDQVEITCRSARASSGDKPVSGDDSREFSRQLLDALVDDHGDTASDVRLSAWLRKSRHSRTDGS